MYRNEDWTLKLATGPFSYCQVYQEYSLDAAEIPYLPKKGDYVLVEDYSQKIVSSLTFDFENKNIILTVETEE